MFIYPDLIKIAVVGDSADGVEEALSVLARRQVPIGKMRVLGPAEFAGTAVRLGQHEFVAETFAPAVLREIDLAYLTRDERVLADFEPRLVKAGVGVVHIASVMFLEAA